MLKKFILLFILICVYFNVSFGMSRFDVYLSNNKIEISQYFSSSQTENINQILKKNNLYKLKLILNNIYDDINPNKLEKAGAIYIMINNLINQEKTLREMIGQMILIGFDGKDISDEDFNKFNISQNIQTGKIGGLVFYGRNIDNKIQFEKFVKDIKNINSNYPLILSIDQEGGKVQRLNEKNGFQNFLSQQKLVENGSLTGAFENYSLMGKMLNELGINVNFAPVVDLNVNPDCPVIGALGRSYSGDVKTVIDYSLQALNAFSQNGVFGTLKHFPGHGSSTVDSHKGFTDVTNTWQQKELQPYNYLISNNYVDIVMSSHVFNSNYDENYPVTLSEFYIKTWLRNDMGYDGVVVTDDLQMGAISNEFGFQEAIKKSVKADNDLLLISNYFDPDANVPEKVIDILINAWKDGEINYEEFEDSFERILKLKNKFKKF